MFSDPASGLEQCIREAKAAVKGIKLHIALTHVGECNEYNGPGVAQHPHKGEDTSSEWRCW